MFQLVEQPRVLNGDDGLGGEIGHQLDLLLRERSYLLAVDIDGANHLILFQHWHAKHTPKASKLDSGSHQRMTFGVGVVDRNVRDVNHPLCFQHTPKGRAWVRAHWSAL